MHDYSKTCRLNLENSVPLSENDCGKHYDVAGVECVGYGIKIDAIECVFD